MDKYERGSKPVIIRGVVDNWPARNEWQVKVYIYLSYLCINTIRICWQNTGKGGSRLGKAIPEGNSKSQ